MAAVPSVLEQTIDAHELKGRIPPRPPAQLSIVPVENQFFINITERLEVLRKLVTDNLIARLPEIQALVDLHEDRRLDQDWTELVAAILRNVSQLSTIPEGAYLALAREPGSQTSQRNLISMQRQIKALLGVDVFSGFDPRTAISVNGFAKASVAKIKTIEAQYFSEIEELVLRQFRAGTRANVVAEEIRERFNVSQKRGRLIARDQISKLNGDLSRQRQTRLGVKHYIWRTSQDERVRPSHAARNGKRFAWNKPPPDGHPGQPIQCRCDADPEVSDLLE